MRRIKKFLFIIGQTKVLAAVIVGAGACLAAIIYFYVPFSAAAAVILPFEGKVTNIEYNCLCSGSIMLTVQPTEATQKQGAQTMDLLFVWAAPLLKKIADVDVPVPTAFLWCYPVFVQTNAQLLGTYVPGGFPCYSYDGTSCSLKGYAQGAILYVGTSAF